MSWVCVLCLQAVGILCVSKAVRAVTGQEPASEKRQGQQMGADTLRHYEGGQIFQRRNNSKPTNDFSTIHLNTS